jgi:hypothetical protein
MHVFLNDPKAKVLSPASAQYPKNKKKKTVLFYPALTVPN